MLELNRLEGCCGIHELNHVQEFEQSGVKALMDQLVKDVASEGAPLPAHIVFSTVRGTIGARLATHIRTNRLGRIAAVPAARNPSSGSNLAMWVWTPNKKMRAQVDVCSECGKPLDEDEE